MSGNFSARQLQEDVMQPFSSHTGIAVPLLKDDINTDQVAPVHRGHGTSAGWRWAIGLVVSGGRR